MLFPFSLPGALTSRRLQRPFNATLIYLISLLVIIALVISSFMRLSHAPAFFIIVCLISRQILLKTHFPFQKQKKTKKKKQKRKKKSLKAVRPC